jgi:16S rRNA (guanine(966)-N(2))-methyltransferase RsmD
MENSSFLDLFSGAGTVAMGAAARGARRVLAVESDRTLASDISRRMTMEKSDQAVAVCVCADVRRAIPKLAKDSAKSEPFNIIFADPPYCMGWMSTLPVMIADNPQILAPDGVFVIERSAREMPIDIIIPRDDRTYGDTVLSFYWNSKALRNS